MQSKLFLLLLICFLTSCEIITITAPVVKKEKKIDIVPTSPNGTVLVLMEELKRSNTYSGSDLFSSNSFTKLKAIDRLYLVSEVDRYKRIISDRYITKLQNDTIANNNIIVYVELNYKDIYKFNTVLIDTLWYITELKL
jgi:hypothetical protein